jgi:hypothetical protein
MIITGRDNKCNKTGQRIKQSTEKTFKVFTKVLCVGGWEDVNLTGVLCRAADAVSWLDDLNQTSVVHMRRIPSGALHCGYGKWRSRGT